MKKESLDYLKNIGITGALVEKVDIAFRFYTEYVGIKIEDIFVSEFIDKGGSRIYENLWFFDGHFCCEAKLFMVSEDYDSDIIKNSVRNFRIKNKDFDIIGGDTNENSRMLLEFGLTDDRLGELKASKENCQQLSMIFKKYIQPNFGTGI